MSTFLDLCSAAIHHKTYYELVLTRHAAPSSLARRHFKDLNCDVSMVATDWFLCLFATSLPPEVAVRVWDVLLFEGSKVGLHNSFIHRQLRLRT